MRTKPVLSESLNNRILCETSWTHDGEVRLQPRTTYSDPMSHCCNASRRPAHEYSSLGPGAKGHFHLNKAKGLGDLRICDASVKPVCWTTDTGSQQRPRKEKMHL